MNHMSSLSACMQDFFTGSEEAQRRFALQRRIELVRRHWMEAVQQVYGPLGESAPPFILQHINAVYVMKAGEAKGVRVPPQLAADDPILVVFCDDSLVRSDLDARQEFLKMRFREQGETIEAFVIAPSYHAMRERHPFRPGDAYGSVEDSSKKTALQQRDAASLLAGKSALERLGPEDRDFIRAQTERIEDAVLRDAIEKAMASSLLFDS